MTDIVLRPMPPGSRRRRSRRGLPAAVGLVVLFSLFQWFCGLYITPPGEGGERGRTALVWRTAEEPFFNSPGTPAGRRGPAGRVLLRGLPYWDWAYRASLSAAARHGGREAAGPVPPRPTPAAGTTDDHERARRLDRIRREIERIREETRREAAGPFASSATR